MITFNNLKDNRIDLFVLASSTVIRLKDISAVTSIKESNGTEKWITHYYNIYIGGSAKPYIHVLDIAKPVRESYVAGELARIKTKTLAEFTAERSSLIESGGRRRQM